jgi:hypothetical protein
VFFNIPLGFGLEAERGKGGSWGGSSIMAADMVVVQKQGGRELKVADFQI